MAVYTVLEQQEIAAFIEPFGIGPLLRFEGIAAGVENTNYCITTDHSELGTENRTADEKSFFLTVFEAIDETELAFYADLTTLLNLRGLPVPCPITDSDGKAIKTLQGKPALLVELVPGEHPKTPSVGQCKELGLQLAQMHKVCLDAKKTHKAARDIEWLAGICEHLAPKLSDDDAKLLEQEMAYFHHWEQALQHSQTELPKAIIHGDLFRDNALFVGDRLSGVIDFNSAGTGYLLYDLAIVVNDWCSRADGSLDPALSSTLLDAYQQRRPLSTSEIHHWNDMLRIAATRFWVSRLLAKLAPAEDHRPGSLVNIKDPAEYRRILCQRIEHPYRLAD